MKSNNGVCIKISKVLIVFLPFLSSLNCDMVKSDRVDHEQCPKVFYQRLLELSIIEQNSAKTNNSFPLNPPLLAYNSYKACFNQFGGTILTPLDDLLWNGCGRCYK